MRRKGDIPINYPVLIVLLLATAFAAYVIAQSFGFNAMDFALGIVGTASDTVATAVENMLNDFSLT